MQLETGFTGCLSPLTLVDADGSRLMSLAGTSLAERLVHGA